MNLSILQVHVWTLEAKNASNWSWCAYGTRSEGSGMAGTCSIPQNVAKEAVTVPHTYQLTPNQASQVQVWDHAFLPSSVIRCQWWKIIHVQTHFLLILIQNIGSVSCSCNPSLIYYWKVLNRKVTGKSVLRSCSQECFYLYGIILKEFKHVG
jgi:hypothetical protein